MRVKKISTDKCLRILQKPEKKEHLRERAKKYINITALKRWLEAGELFVEDDEVLGIYNH